jgi:hypothetical protein
MTSRWPIARATYICQRTTQHHQQLIVCRQLTRTPSPHYTHLMMTLTLKLTSICQSSREDDIVLSDSYPWHITFLLRRHDTMLTVAELGLAWPSVNIILRLRGNGIGKLYSIFFTLVLLASMMIQFYHDGLHSFCFDDIAGDTAWILIIALIQTLRCFIVSLVFPS